MAGRKPLDEAQRRSETITVRLDPTLRYAVELASARNGQTVSSLVQWAVSKAMADIKVGKIEDKESILEVASRLRPHDLQCRLVMLGLDYPELLTFKERVMFGVIEQHSVFWRKSSRPKTFDAYKLDNVREFWDALNMIGDGKWSIEAIEEEISQRRVERG